jgi:hypothetical protein
MSKAVNSFIQKYFFVLQNQRIEKKERRRTKKASDPNFLSSNCLWTKYSVFFHKKIKFGVNLLISGNIHQMLI